jgi:hypothetical protein
LVPFGDRPVNLEGVAAEVQDELYFLLQIMEGPGYPVKEMMVEMHPLGQGLLMTQVVAVAARANPATMVENFLAEEVATVDL